MEPLRILIVGCPDDPNKRSHIDHLDDSGSDGFELLRCILNGELAFTREDFADSDFCIKEVKIPEQFGKRYDFLHLGVPEDEVEYVCRDDRTYTSRVCRREPYHSDKMVVLGKKVSENDVEYISGWFGGLSEKELNDPYLKDEERAKSEEFWSEAGKGGALTHPDVIAEFKKKHERRHF